MKKTLILGMILSCLFCRGAFAEVTLKAEVDKKSLSTDEILTYKITISYSDVKVSDPALPVFQGFQVVSSAQSSSISLGRGKGKSSLSYAFVLAPEKAGKIKIEAASIKADGQTYSSDAFEIEVTQGARQPQPVLPKTKPTSPKKSVPQSEEPEITL
jgi:hypothetical protein